MIHENKDEFLRILEHTSAQTGFGLLLLEKDYYLTLILSEINTLSEDLIFKGGTCLNKIYYSYYCLSEDLDFTIKLPSGNPSRTVKRKMMKPAKDGILSYVQTFGMRLEDLKNTAHNESSQYIFYIDYDSVVIEKRQSIKLEISLRFNPVLPPSNKKIKHHFLHPFTGEPLFDGGSVVCLDLKEIVAEKMRAAATRHDIAPRDFYDLGFIIKSGFNFQDDKLWELFKTKLVEDGFDADISRYRINMGRSDDQIASIADRLDAELLAVLTPQERESFQLEKTLVSINNIFRLAR
jgi:predicted nucleotidyltransferase component of viral defense system